MEGKTRAGTVDILNATTTALVEAACRLPTTASPSYSHDRLRDVAGGFSSLLSRGRWTVRTFWDVNISKGLQDDAFVVRDKHILVRVAGLIDALNARPDLEPVW